jgi:Holliday junction resolvase-like predicted endonuclease
MMSAVLSAALLRETRKNLICQTSEIVASTRICRSLVVESLLKLRERGAVALAGEEIQVSLEQRLRIAELAIAIGADPERIARELRWQEFEAFAAQVLARDGFATLNHFVFKESGRRFEIDVIAAKEPMVLCVDCKHWHHGWAPSKIGAAARNQLLRVLCLSQAFPVRGTKLPTGTWRSVRLLPIVLTLADVSRKLIHGVPIVSALRFRSFLSEINPWIDKLRFVDVPKCQLMLV